MAIFLLFDCYVQIPYRRVQKLLKLTFLQIKQLYYYIFYTLLFIFLGFFLKNM